MLLRGVWLVRRHVKKTTLGTQINELNVLDYVPGLRLSLSPPVSQARHHDVRRPFRLVQKLVLLV